MKEYASVVSPRTFCTVSRGGGRAGELLDRLWVLSGARGLFPLVLLLTIGRSEEGRDIVMLAIADEQGIQELERLRAATAALADPRTTDAAAAERIVREPVDLLFTRRFTLMKPDPRSRCWSWPIGSRSLSSR